MATRLTATGLARLDAKLERAVVTRADAVTAVTPQVAADFRRRFGKSAAFVPNGWDPKLEPEVTSTQTNTFRNGRFMLLHTGKLTGPRGRTPGPPAPSSTTTGTSSLADRIPGEVVLTCTWWRQPIGPLARSSVAGLPPPDQRGYTIGDHQDRENPQISVRPRQASMQSRSHSSVVSSR